MEDGHVDKVDKKSRARGENWTAEERMELLDIMKPYIKVIESKGSDTDRLTKKKQAWTQIHNSFCAKFGSTRTLQKVKVSDAISNRPIVEYSIQM